MRGLHRRPQQSRELADLAELVITPEEKVVLDSLKASVVAFDAIQTKYLVIIAAKDFANAIKFGDESVRPSAEKVASDIDKSSVFFPVVTAKGGVWAKQETQS